MAQTHSKQPGRPAARAEQGRSAREVAGGVRLEDRPQVELYELAQKLGIAGYAELSRTELIEALRRR